MKTFKNLGLKVIFTLTRPCFLFYKGKARKVGKCCVKLWVTRLRKTELIYFYNSRYAVTLWVLIFFWYWKLLHMNWFFTRQIIYNISILLFQAMRISIQLNITLILLKIRMEISCRTQQMKHWTILYVLYQTRYWIF